MAKLTNLFLRDALVPLQNGFRRALAHADAVGDADAGIGVAGEIKTGNRGGAGLDFGEALRMAHGVLRHGTGPAGNAREARARGDTGDLP